MQNATAGGLLLLSPALLDLAALQWEPQHLCLWAAIVFIAEDCWGKVTVCLVSTFTGVFWRPLLRVTLWETLSVIYRQ